MAHTVTIILIIVAIIVASAFGLLLALFLHW